MKPLRKLNSNQHNTLLLTHKFRFITSALLACHKNVNQSATQRTLETLRKSGYLNRHYNKSYKLQGKAARYYLSKQGNKYLKSNEDIENEMLNLHYKNKNMGQAYIDHCIDVYGLCLKLKDQYPYHDIFSRIELSRDDRFLTPAPDLYLEGLSDTHNDIFIDLFTNTQTWIVKKRVDTYIEQYEDGGWHGYDEEGNQIDSDYPEVHIYCDNRRIAESVESYIRKRLNDEFIENLKLKVVYLSTSSGNK